jgi:hypothetical protein
MGGAPDRFIVACGENPTQHNTNLNQYSNSGSSGNHDDSSFSGGRHGVAGNGRGDTCALLRVDLGPSLLSVLQIPIGNYADIQRTPGFQVHATSQNNEENKNHYKSKEENMTPEPEAQERITLENMTENSQLFSVQFSYSASNSDLICASSVIISSRAAKQSSLVVIQQTGGWWFVEPSSPLISDFPSSTFYVRAS